MAQTYQTTIPAGNLTPEQFIALTSLSMKDLQWEHRVIDNNKVEGRLFNGNTQQKIVVTVYGDEVIIDTGYEDWVLLDLGRNKKTTFQLIDTIGKKTPVYTGEELDSQLQLLHDQGNETENMEGGELAPTEKLNIHTGLPIITSGLIAINLILFVLMVVSGVGIFEPTSRDILEWGGNFKIYTMGGEWWRLISAAFIHIGIVHLVFNMYALFSVGLFLEPILGKWRFLAAYLATAALASLVSILWHDQTVSAGASGAIFGMYGLFLALLTTKMPEIKTNKSMLTGIVVFVAYNLIYGLREGIDNAAHIGGLVSGLALGYLYYAGRHTDLHRYYATSCLTIAALAAFIFLAGKKDDSIAFSKLLDQFVVIEQEAMQPLINKETLTPEEFIRQSKEISLPQWQKASYLLQPAFNYRMPEEMHARRALLVEYVKLRSSLTYALIKYENSGAIEDLIDARYLGTRIERIIQELNP